MLILTIFKYCRMSMYVMNDIQETQGRFSITKVDRIIQKYRNRYVKFLKILLTQFHTFLVLLNLTPSAGKLLALPILESVEFDDNYSVEGNFKQLAASQNQNYRKIKFNFLKVKFKLVQTVQTTRSNLLFILRNEIV